MDMGRPWNVTHFFATPFAQADAYTERPTTGARIVWYDLSRRGAHWDW